MRIGVYSPNWIGDSVISIPFIQSLKDQEPDAEITIICKEWVTGVYDNHPAVNEIIPLSKTKLTGFINIIKTGRDLREYDFDRFYTLTDSFRSALILWLSNAQRRHGYSSQMRSMFLTDAMPRPNKNIHRSKKYLNLIQSGLTTLDIPKIHLSNSESKWAEKEMAKLELSKPVALFPFSVANNRTIPNEILIKWIDQTNNDYLVFGSKNDIERGETLINVCNGNSIRSICGGYSLRESIALISVCKYALATDSGLGHVSAALGLPTVSFFCVGIDAVTGPVGENTTIIKYCSPCLGDLCKDHDGNRSCIKEISRFDIEVAVNRITNQ